MNELPFPNKKYQVIYADPAWKYSDKRNGKGKNNPTGAGGAVKHYRCMTIEEIQKLPVKELADDNCYLFMWATSPFMKDAIGVLESWGFKFITIPFVWVKMRNDMSEPRKDGIGNYTLNNAEYVLLGRKGKYWRNSTLVKQILLAPKQEHSKKPDEVRQRILDLCGDVPRIELFARQKAEGWDSWGNEVSEGDTQECFTCEHDINLEHNCDEYYEKCNKCEAEWRDSSEKGQDEFKRVWEVKEDE